MSGEMSTTGSIDDALDNLDPSVQDNEDEPTCENCAKPRSKRKVKHKNIGGAGFAPICPDCGAKYERIEADLDDAPIGGTPNLEGTFIQSDTGRFHIVTSGEDTACGYSGGRVVEHQVPHERVCNNCKEELGHQRV